MSLRLNRISIAINIGVENVGSGKPLAKLSPDRSPTRVQEVRYLRPHVSHLRRSWMPVSCTVENALGMIPPLFVDAYVVAGNQVSPDFFINLPVVSVFWRTVVILVGVGLYHYKMASRPTLILVTFLEMYHALFLPLHCLFASLPSDLTVEVGAEKISSWISSWLIESSIQLKWSNWIFIEY